MNLQNKKELAARTLKVGKNRIVFNSNNLSEIKEAITKQDILSLVQEGIISIKPVHGRRKLVKRNTRRGSGKIKKKIGKRKQIYVKITRKLRRYLMELKNRGSIDPITYKDARKKIRMSMFRSKAHLREYLEGSLKTGFENKKENKKNSESKK